MANDPDETATMNVSMPKSMRSFVSERMSGRFGNASEYVRELIRRDQDRQAQEHLETLLLDGVKSGKASPLTKQDWTELRAEVAERLEKRR